MRMDLDGTGVEGEARAPRPDRDRDLGGPARRAARPRTTARSCTAADCAADIVAAMEDDDGFEYYTPEEVPGGWRQKDLVVGKTQSCDDFLTGMAQMG